MTAGSSSSSSRHPRPVPWIEALVPATHGSIDAHGSERNLGPKVLDFSANGNVIGPSQTVAPALAAVDLSRYPDRYALELRRAIAKCDGVDIEEVVAGNGSTELIWAVARAYLAPGDRALVVSPAYGEYAVASLASGAQVESVWTFHPEVAVRGGPLPSNEDAVSESALAANNAGDLVELLKPALVEMPPKVVWICHPNNPTGRLFPVEALPELIRLAPGTLFAVDEAYLTLCAGVTSVLPLLGTGQIVILRSLTKDLGLAGIRVGYALAVSEIRSVLQRVLPPWSVSALAQIAGTVALADRAHLEHARMAVAESRRHLVAGLVRVGLCPYPSVTNFVLVPVGSGTEVSEALLARGFAVRDCTSFGLPDCIRIGVRSIPDQELLLAALTDLHLVLPIDREGRTVDGRLPLPIDREGRTVDGRLPLPLDGQWDGGGRSPQPFGEGGNAVVGGAAGGAARGASSG